MTVTHWSIQLALPKAEILILPEYAETSRTLTLLTSRPDIKASRRTKNVQSHHFTLASLNKILCPWSQMIVWLLCLTNDPSSRTLWLASSLPAGLFRFELMHMGRRAEAEPTRTLQNGAGLSFGNGFSIAISASRTYSLERCRVTASGFRLGQSSVNIGPKS